MLVRGHPAAGRPLQVGFDEVHHGEGGVEGWKTVVYSPVGLAGALVLLVILVQLATSGRRLGRAIPATDPRLVPPPGGVVGALAQLFQRSPHRPPPGQRYAGEPKEPAAPA